MLPGEISARSVSLATHNFPETEPRMPKQQVSDLITDQEIAFARLILSGTMTDSRAAEAVGLNPGTAAYTKSKPRVRAYMLEHRAAVREQLVQTETEGLRRLSAGREQVLARLWEIANLSPEATRSSITGQVKALAMIVAIEGMIPDRPTASAKKESAAPPLPRPDIYVSKWLRESQQEPTTPESSLVQEGEQANAFDPCPLAAQDVLPDPDEAADAPPDPSPIPSLADDSSAFTFSEATSPVSHAHVVASPPDTRLPFSIPKKPLRGATDLRREDPPRR